MRCNETWLLKLEELPMRPGGIIDIAPDAEEIDSYDSNQIDYHLTQP